MTEAGELPACDAARRTWLAYVEAEGAFRFCSSKGEWSAVELHGKDGEDGVAGVDGRDGVAADTTWRDPATGRLWLYGSSVYASDAYGAGCAAGWALPSRDDAAEGWRNGLGAGAQVLGITATSFWIVQEDGVQTAYGVSAGTYTQVLYRAGLWCYRLTE